MTPEPAYPELMALIARMRSDWDSEQIVAELAGCPWSPHLVVEAVRATNSTDDRLNVAHAFVRMPSERMRVTPEQLAAYTAYVRRRLAARSDTTDG
ncbi:hypothetical protein [Streptosporangium sp. NPDC051022]|uniref:hypothetical protein n=1 Tax=Streptosporangium sp. NPDC051022 TaxID=3155752 RepID=UPI00342B62EF